MNLTGRVVFVCSGMSLTGPVLCFLWWNESYWSCSGMSLTGPVVFVCSGMSLTGPVVE